MRWSFLRLLWLLVLVTVLPAFGPALPVVADSGGWSATGPSTGVQVVAVDPGNSSLVYAGGSSGLWKSADGGGTWQQVGATALGHFLAIDPFAPNVLYAGGLTSHAYGNGTETYTSEDRLLKSGDGGATWNVVYQVTGPPAGQQSVIKDVLLDPNRQGAVFLALAGNDPCCAQVASSLDGGKSWALILPLNIGEMSYNTTLASSLSVLPGVPGLLDVGIISYHGGSIMQTSDAYAVATPVWSEMGAPSVTLTGPSLLAMAGDAAHHSLYSVWTLMGSSELGRIDDDSRAVSLGGELPFRGPGQYDFAEVDAIAVNRQQPRWLYAAITATTTSSTPRQGRGVFASPDGGQTWLPLPALAQPVGQLVLAVPSHMLFAVTSAGVYRFTITWPTAAPFTGYYQQTDGLRLLGSAISPQVTANGYPAQYFEKARLEDHSADNVPSAWRYMDGLLVDELQQAQAPLPIGGDASLLSYAGLHDLADPAKRLPAPAGYAGSSVMVQSDGSVFVPFTADLSGAAGHLVAAPFWSYIQRSDLFPGGWLHDVGLPISDAMTIQVTKDLPGGPVQRTIMVQAFQRTILTDDPQNPPAWQVERANVGTDYRRTFPAQVGP